MYHKTRTRRTFSFLLTAALVLAQVAAFVTLPRSASAQSVDPAALSADPNAEIVYIDVNGVIRVLDTQGDPLVQWVSPSGGWDQVVLLDVNADGDQEILALDKIDDDDMIVTLFDPVVSFGSTNPSQQYNGIPWDTLWTTRIPRNGEYVVGGDFDAGIPGDEFVIGFRDDINSIVQIYNAASLDGNGRPTGRDMKIHIEKVYPELEYKYGVSGQLNGEGADELVLFDPESGVTRMAVFRPDQDMLLLDDESSDNDRYKFGAVGQIIEDGSEEIAAILTTSRPDRTSVRTYYLTNDADLEQDAAWAFAPQPEWVFLADVTGNGDEEVLFLRNYPEGEEGPRLIMRDDWGDDDDRTQDLIEWRLMEDGAENQFRAGAGGDVDGDGRDEIIIMRDDRIRVYHRPENGNEGDANYNDYFVDTDNSRINLVTGDLDRNGFTTGPILMVSGNMIDAIIPAGTVSQDFVVSVNNVGTDGSIGINAVVPGGNPWAEVNPIFSNTPANFRVRFNASDLAPGSYSTTMTLRTNRANVINDNYVVYLNLTVVPPVLQPKPPILNFFSCEDAPCANTSLPDLDAPFTTTVQIDGSSELAFRAAIIGVPAADGTAVTAATVDGLSGPITKGALDEFGNIIISDAAGNSRTLASQQVSAAAVHSTTVSLELAPSWVTSATLDTNVVPADMTLVIDPAILTAEGQREYAVMVLVADTRAGTPNGNVTLVPIQLANIGHLLWAGLIVND